MLNGFFAIIKKAQKLQAVKVFTAYVLFILFASCSHYYKPYTIYNKAVLEQRYTDKTVLKFKEGNSIRKMAERKAEIPFKEKYLLIFIGDQKFELHDVKIDYNTNALIGNVTQVDSVKLNDYKKYWPEYNKKLTYNAKQERWYAIGQTHITLNDTQSFRGMNDTISFTDIKMIKDYKKDGKKTFLIKKMPYIIAGGVVLIAGIVWPIIYFWSDIAFFFEAMAAI